eukprot:6212780-Pleurochrysis_carterae.AAC.3
MMAAVHELESNRLLSIQQCRTPKDHKAFCFLRVEIAAAAQTKCAAAHTHAIPARTCDGITAEFAKFL